MKSDKKENLKQNLVRTSFWSQDWLTGVRILDSTSWCYLTTNVFSDTPKVERNCLHRQRWWKIFLEEGGDNDSDDDDKDEIFA